MAAGIGRRSSGRVLTGGAGDDAAAVTPSRQSARQALSRLLDAQPQSMAPELSTGRWLRSWLTRRVDLRPSTRRMYESHLRLYLLPGLARIPLAELSALQIGRMVAGASAATGPAGRCRRRHWPGFSRRCGQR